MLKVESTFQASAIGSSCYRQTIVKKMKKAPLLKLALSFLEKTKNNLLSLLNLIQKIFLCSLIKRSNWLTIKQLFLYIHFKGLFKSFTTLVELNLFRIDQQK